MCILQCSVGGVGGAANFALGSFLYRDTGEQANFVSTIMRTDTLVLLASYVYRSNVEHFVSLIRTINIRILIEISSSNVFGD